MHDACFYCENLTKLNCLVPSNIRDGQISLTRADAMRRLHDCIPLRPRDFTSRHFDFTNGYCSQSLHLRVPSRLTFYGANPCCAPRNQNKSNGRGIERGCARRNLLPNMFRTSVFWHPRRTRNSTLRTASCLKYDAQAKQ